MLANTIFLFVVIFDDEVPKNDLLENQGNVKQKVISYQFVKNKVIKNII